MITTTCAYTDMRTNIQTHVHTTSMNQPAIASTTTTEKKKEKNINTNVESIAHTNEHTLTGLAGWLISNMYTITKRLTSEKRWN